LGSLFEKGTLQPLFSRTVAIELLHMPFIIATSLGIENYSILRFLWKIGYSAPFFLVAFCFHFLTKKWKNFGLIYLIFSVVIFYLPNSMFAVGEYLILLAIIPLLIAAVKELMDSGTISSKLIVFICIILLAKTYEVGAVFAAICCMILICLQIKRSVYRQNGFLTKYDFLLLIFILFVVAYFLVTDIIFMPNWLKENSSAGFHHYLTWERYGALWDTWFVFQVIASISLLVSLVYPVYTPSKIFLLIAIVFIISLVSLFANHQPDHSYTSKTFFLALYVFVSLSIIFIPIHEQSFTVVLKIICPIILSVSVFTLTQGFGFEKYRNHIVELSSTSIESKNIYVSKLDYFKEGVGRKYSWTWGHACISYLSSPRGNIVVGDLDKNYSPNKIKENIKLNEKN
jgi:hypothetical protein